MTVKARSDLRNLFGVNLAIRREEAGYRQRELAELVKSTQHSICSYECGKAHPQMDVLQLICKTLGCTASDLLGF